MEYTLTMVFVTERGKQATISVSGVKPDLTQANVDTLMDAIIAKNIFITDTGALITKQAAHLTAKTVTKYAIGK